MRRKPEPRTLDDVVDDLLKLDDITERGSPTEDMVLSGVEAALRAHAVTVWEFMDLDEHPGKWGYQIRGREWHYKLRRWRNSERFPKFTFARSKGD